MLQETTKNAIDQSAPEQLDKLFNELTEAISLRSLQGLGTDETLNEMVANLTSEINAHKIGD
jgi:hypothetical protein